MWGENVRVCHFFEPLGDSKIWFWPRYVQIHHTSFCQGLCMRYTCAQSWFYETLKPVYGAISKYDYYFFMCSFCIELYEEKKCWRGEWEPYIVQCCMYIFYADLLSLVYSNTIQSISWNVYDKSSWHLYIFTSLMHLTMLLKCIFWGLYFLHHITDTDSDSIRAVQH